MKKRLTFKIVFVLIFVAGVFAAGPTISDLSVNADNGNALLSWYATGETSQQEFLIQRRESNQISFDVINKVPANGSGHYTYQDNSIYKTSDQVYIYEVTLVDINNPAYYIASSQPASAIIGNISGIKRTWGSIKAMFR